MLPVAANGQPAAAAYHRQPDGSYRVYAIVVLTATPTGIARLVVFADPHLFRWFDLLQTYSYAQRDQPAG
jgi:RNA polymerase sigma-70 factor (ECF subfamily)